MMTLALLVGMVILGDVVLSVAALVMPGEPISGIGVHQAITFLGLPLAVALSGGVGSLILMAKQRDAELALSGVVGTTPAQRTALPILEGAIITVSGVLLSLIPLGAMIGDFAIALPVADFPFAFDPSYAVFGAAVLACAVVTIAATWLPTIPARRLPEQRVIARLVAE